MISIRSCRKDTNRFYEDLCQCLTPEKEEDGDVDE
jgi:hypothetical protein